MGRPLAFVVVMVRASPVVMSGCDTITDIGDHAFYCVLALDVAQLMGRQAHHGSLDLGVRELLATPGGVEETVLISPPGSVSAPPATHLHRHDPTSTAQDRTGQNSPATVSRY
jgi:hypothetical protein